MKHEDGSQCGIPAGAGPIKSFTRPIGNSCPPWGPGFPTFAMSKKWTDIVEGTYETTLLKKGGDWVISQFKFDLKDWSGNRQLAAIAIERMKKAQ